MLLVLASHFLGCLWIFIAKFSYDPQESNNTNWIIEGGYENESIGDLYFLACYFAVQTITTVGYGDFTITSVPERIICIIM